MFFKNKIKAREVNARMKSRQKAVEFFNSEETKLKKIKKMSDSDGSSVSSVVDSDC